MECVNYLSRQPQKTCCQKCLHKCRLIWIGALPSKWAVWMNVCLTISQQLKTNLWKSLSLADKRGESPRKRGRSYVQSKYFGNESEVGIYITNKGSREDSRGRDRQTDRDRDRQRECQRWKNSYLGFQDHPQLFVSLSLSSTETKALKHVFMNNRVW
jgi:hypothetical protein